MTPVRIRAVSREERPKMAALDGKFEKNVKFFLDNGDPRRYPPRFIPEGPTPWG
jgi:hypothetical protein